MHPGRRLTRVLVAVLAVTLLAHVIHQVKPLAHPDPDHVKNLILVPLVGAVFCFADAWLLLGWRRALVLLVVAAGLGWAAEQVGVNTSAVFGSYYYTDKLGPKIGDVPAVIPIFWFMMVHLSYVIAHLIAEDTPDAAPGRSMLRTGWLAALAALIATAYDLGLDPYMASPKVQAWVWDPPPRPEDSYFGVPVRNFYGWAAVTFVVLMVVHLVDRELARRYGRGATAGGLTHLAPRVAKLVVALPVGLYFFFWLSHLSREYPPPVEAVSLVALGIPAMAAVTQWRRWRIGAGPP